mmetsp:Transcript_293/g.944  ORF Transcript_293/g.944 Transcript_293/m.944 type:complete len:241 (+) Transcript_293:2035-2757(+)
MRSEARNSSRAGTTAGETVAATAGPAASPKTLSWTSMRRRLGRGSARMASMRAMAPALSTRDMPIWNSSRSGECLMMRAMAWAPWSLARLLSKMSRRRRVAIAGGRGASAAAGAAPGAGRSRAPRKRSRSAMLSCVAPLTPQRTMMSSSRAVCSSSSPRRGARPRGPMALYEKSTRRILPRSGSSWSARARYAATACASLRPATMFAKSISTIPGHEAIALPSTVSEPSECAQEPSSARV